MAIVKPKLLTPLDFQEESLDVVGHHLTRGINRQMGVMATGLGKTAGVSAQVPRRFPHLMERQKGGHGGLLFIVHRREILYDAYRTFKDAYPDKWIGIEMGDEHCVGDEDMIFASADSLGTLMGNRILKLSHRIFGAIILDEAHHLSLGSKWDRIMNFFGVGSDLSQRARLPDGELPLALLLTATPNRGDGKPLSPFVDKIGGEFRPVFNYNYAWGVRNGWVVDIRVTHAVDGSDVMGRERALDGEIAFMARTVRDYCQNQKTLAFCRSVDQSATLAATLMANKIARAAHVDGETDKDLRKEILQQFKDGDLDLVTNFGVFTEGTNIPSVQTLLMNRPTDSPTLLPQIVGRVTRPHPEANVYQYKTARERLDAIASSPKPYGNVICTFSPEEWDLNIVAALTGHDTKINPDGQTIMEVVDVIEYFEEERPEVDTADISNLDDLKVRLREVDVWTQTVYNDDLKALSPLAYTQQGDALAIHLPENPFSTDAYDQVPVVVEFKPASNGRWETVLIECGGYNKVIKRPRPASMQSKGWNDSLQEGVTKLDYWLRNKRPDLYLKVQRGTHQPASKASIKYLKNAGVKHGENITQATADLLAADHRIKLALKQIDKKYNG